MSARAAWASIAAISVVLLLAPAAAIASRPATLRCPEPSSLVAILQVPEARRARCFGHRPITFEAWGWTLMNVWPGVRVPKALGGDFVLSTTSDPWRPGSVGPRDLTVFLPRSIRLPDPVGTPWENRDGIAPGDAWWRVTGHFDDPLATRCRPVHGDNIDGVEVDLSARRVRAFCRNHFVIDRLVWLPDGPPDTAAGSTVTVRQAGFDGGAVKIALAVGVAAFLAGLRRSAARAPRRGCR